jgi:DNA-binding CsgD family transcriptional regulator/DNA polymerase III delta prime subunit
MSSILGRQSELDALEPFLDAVDSGRGPVLLFSGQAGIGKTTLWTAATEAATERGYRVVTARPTEVETGLAFAALGDLLGPFLETDVPDLPAPQRDALDAALLRAATTSPPQPLGVSLAVLHILRAASAPAPVLVAIDDVPWLDEASVRALDFAVRRLETERVGFLLARRAATIDEPLPRWLATLPPDRVTRLDLGPLSIDATGALLRDRIGLRLSRPVLARLHGIAGGTPFYALELGRDLQLRGAWAAPEALEVPSSLDRLVGARIDALDPAAGEVALHVAALAHPTMPVLAAALEPTQARRGIDHAVTAGVLDVASGSVRFTHPLLAAATYARAEPERRRAVHERLAEVVTEPEERARHLARAAIGPDENVARALELGATAAAGRGASEVAVELAEEAARMTPPDAEDERQRRRFVAAEHLIVSGDLRRADALLGSIASAVPPGPLRADVLTRRALVALYLSDLELSEALLREAMPLSADDPRRRVTIHALLAGIGHLSWRGWRHARFDMREALRLAHELGDAALELQMLGHAATWAFGLGRPWRGLLERADALAVPIGDVPPLEHPDLQFARLLVREGDVSEARRRIERLVEGARSAGDWTSLPRLLVSLAYLVTEAGDWDGAERIADEAQAGLLQSGEGAFYDDLLIHRLNFAAARGDVDLAHALAATIEPNTGASPQPIVRTAPSLALATLDLSLGEAGRALERLAPIVAEPALGRLLPMRREMVVAMQAEALVGLGRAEEARASVDVAERRARRRGPATALAEVLRARALVLAAQGDHAAATRSAEEAVAILSGVQLPFRSARAWFALGEVRRRSRQKATSRAAFETALAGFEALGATIWIERTRSELARVASRRPTGSRLTDTERRVAELAGSGHTNREIADALFMSVHTVEAHLTRVFRALGVQSRTELARVDLDAAETLDGPSVS